MPSPFYGRFTEESSHPRTRDPFAVECSGCGAHVDRAASWPCAGSHTCEERMGDCCKQACFSCSKPACPMHLVELAGEKFCSLCAGFMVEEAARELAEELEMV